MINFDLKNWKKSIGTTIAGAIGAAGVVVYQSLIAQPPQPINWQTVGIAAAVFTLGAFLGIETPQQKAEKEAKKEILKEKVKEELLSKEPPQDTVNKSGGL